MNPKITKLLFAMAFLSMFASQQLLAQKKLNKTFPGVKKIRMSTASGNCVLRKSGDMKVTVDLTYSFDENDYEPVISQEGDLLVIKEKFRGNSSRGNADWELSVPDHIEIQFTTGSGNVEASDLSFNLKATTGSGNYTFNRLSGDLTLNTGSGNIDLDGVTGTIEATTGSGHFRVSKSSGELTLTTGSGSHKLGDSKAVFRVTTGSGNITGNDISITGSSSFTTGSGNTEVVLAAAPQFDISLASGSGDAVLDFNGHDIKGEIVMKAGKKHGEINAPFAFDKTEEISQWKDQVTVQKTAIRGTTTPHISISTGTGEATIKK